MSWRNVAKTLDLHMSTVIDACSEIPSKGQRWEERKHNLLPNSGLPLDKHLLSEHLEEKNRSKLDVVVPEGEWRPLGRNLGDYGESVPF
jgi:hypothetical protein